MKSLFLVTNSYDNVSSCIPIIEKLRGREATLVIALDFWAGKKLRDRGILYKTPDEYLDMAACQRIDDTALEMMRTWYKPMGDRLSYKDVPLGEMAELDFGYLFVETLRSIELAGAILSSESPDKIFLPQRFPPQEIRSLDTMCYRTLPAALKHFAELGKTPVFAVKPSLAALLMNRWQDLSGKSEFLIPWLVATLGKLFGTIRSPFKASQKNVVLFYGVPFFGRLSRELEKQGVASVDIFRLPYPPISKMAAGKIAELRQLWAEFSRDKNLRSSLYYNGVSLFGILKDRFHYFFNGQAPGLISNIEWAEMTMQLLQPRLLVVMDDMNTVYRAVCRTFKVHGIPILVIQHGTGSLTGYSGMVGFQIMPLEAQRQAVWGEIYRDEWGVKRGKPAETQVVTGNPKYDFIAEDYRPSKKDLCRKLGLDADKGIIVVATEWYVGETATATSESGERYMRCVIGAMKAFPDEQIVIKLHPTFHKKYGQIAVAIAHEEIVDVTITRNYLWELLAVSDLVVVSNSTVGLDALVLDKSLVMVITDREFEAVPYASLGAALKAGNKQDVIAAAASILSDEQVRLTMAQAREHFVYQFAYQQDGKAYQRVARLIGQMLSAARPD